MRSILVVFFCLLASPALAGGSHKRSVANESPIAPVCDSMQDVKKFIYTDNTTLSASDDAVKELFDGSNCALLKLKFGNMSVIEVIQSVNGNGTYQILQLENILGVQQEGSRWQHRSAKKKFMIMFMPGKVI